MDRRGRWQVSPDALEHEAGALGAISHPAEYGAARTVLALAEAVSGAESLSAAARFGQRSTAAFTGLEEQRAGLTRALRRAAAVYAGQEAQVEAGMRPGS
ncbi:hypothetical protein [Allobranchiibius sp. GilTou73]|uniref:hypothetical protein n=1 Tax=Allobranchiibius sp. GilTou73 TaxID=2904523 RepID=UPI001F17DBDC|nr:hypothetical protein [Allobranchiibius sp. GilTou73]UIJ34441.1 hypothetical protein LVQ62_15210 [Allobranchiibius sp. GilTou73]